jgi:acyl-CoA synthetase (NDP forming)
LSRDVGALFEPRSVAVLGASTDTAKWGHWLARGVLQGEHRRSVYLVNRNGGEILGRRAYRSLAELPEPPELVALAVPADGFEEAVDDALAAGARALIVIAAGLGESGEPGKARERAVVARVREAGAVLLGPNCLGVFDAEAELSLTSNELPVGPVGVISQSGNLALEVGLLADDVGLGFSRFASLGNQADLEAADLVEAFTAHEPTKVIAVYCEDFRDGRAFARVAQAAVEGGKPVILLTVGGGEASARAALSHTGALVSDLAAVDAACRAAGIERVSSPKELVDLVQVCLAEASPCGRRTAVVGDGGGHCALAADAVAAEGLELPLLSDELSGRLAAMLPATAATRNPVDLAGGGEQDVFSFERVVRALLDSGEVDGLLLTGYFGGYSLYSDTFSEDEKAVGGRMARAVTECGRPLIVHTMYASSSAAQELRAGDVPVYREIEAAVRALAKVARRAGEAPGRVPSLPEPVAGPARAGYWEARELLTDADVPIVDARPVGTPAEALAAARDLGFPLVLKAVGLVHKSDAGGVITGIASEAELEIAFADLRTKVPGGAYSVERMAPLAEGLELIVGARRDARFGPIALVGIGGIYTELLGDVAVALAPVDEDEADELLRSLKGAPLLLGARGRPPLALRAAARTVAAVSRVAAARPEIAEIEVNPLLATPRDVVALDARIVLGKKGEG